MTWVVGLIRLGCEVWFVEEVRGAAHGDWFRAVTERFGVARQAVLVRTSTDGCWSVDASAGADVVVTDLLRDASLLINVSGNLRHPDLVRLPNRAVYVDLDPGFTQIWAARGTAGLALEHHQLHFSVGENLGSGRCPLPTGGYRWLPCRQPVVLEDWPVVGLADAAPFTTVATWRCPSGALEWDGTTFGLKLHEFRKMIALPAAVPVDLELALDIDPADEPDRRRLVRHGWRVRPARE